MCLNGDAQSLLDGLEASELSYDMALKSLDKRYNHKRRIILSYVRGSLNVNRADSTPASLRLMHTTFLSEINALYALKEPVEQWDTLLIGIMVWKLDDKTLDAWELSLKSPVLPTFDDLSKFVEARCNSLEAYEESQPVKSIVTNKSGPSQGYLTKRNVCAATSSNANSKKCPCCNDNPRIYACQKFKEKSPAERIQIVKAGRLCYNCLSDRHIVAQCIGGKCRVCNLKHNSLLHLPKPVPNADAVIDDQPQDLNNIERSEVVVSACCNKETQNKVLLATAVVLVVDQNNKYHKLRAMLDSGSQINILRSAAAKKLCLVSNQSTLRIRGIGNTNTKANFQTTLEVQSLYSSGSWRLEFQVVNQCLVLLPDEQVITETWEIPISIQERLADPCFAKQGEIDMLLGAELFFDILEEGKWKPSADMPLFMNTQLGWIVSGPIKTTFRVEPRDFKCMFQVWDSEPQEDVIRLQSEEEAACKDHFIKNYSCTISGRFMVRIPLKESSQILGNSLSMATSRFLRLDSRFQLHEQYKSFMDEYISLNHMEEIVEGPVISDRCYYMPHHPVIREDSITTNLRVVFDASAKSTSQTSLNELMMIGPTVESDLATIFLKFRTYKFTMCADVTKMYRQILVDPQDRDLQRIVWRNGPHEQLKHYRMRTITYGTASAPFLATRCLKQIGLDAEEEYPDAARVIQQDFYVDDLLSGSAAIEGARTLQRQVQTILSRETKKMVYKFL